MLQLNDLCRRLLHYSVQGETKWIDQREVFLNTKGLIEEENRAGTRRCIKHGTGNARLLFGEGPGRSMRSGTGLKVVRIVRIPRWKGDLLLPHQDMLFDGLTIIAGYSRPEMESGGGNR